MNVAEYLARTLALSGVPFVPGLPGTTVLEPLEALRVAGVPFVATRHEQSAAHMADAVGRLGRHAGIAIVDIGPGLANTLSGVLAAHRDSSPMIVVAGTEERALLGREVWHEMADAETFRHVTRRAARVAEARDVPDQLAATIRAATTGRPGPALLSVPKDLWTEPVVAPGAFPSLQVPGERPVPPDEDLDAVAAMLGRASRPLLLTGSGVLRSGAGELSTRLAATWDLPVVTSPNGRGAVPESHACCAGVTGRFGNRTASRLLREADLVLAVGCRLSDLTTANWSLLNSAQSIVHVDSDPDELGRNWPVTIGIVADAREFLAGLIVTMEAESRRRRGTWSGRDLAAPRHAERRRFLALAHDERVLPQHVMGQLLVHARQPHRLLMGSGRHQQFVGEWPIERGGQLMYAANSGAMGFALPAAIATQLAEPSTSTLCCLGDGDFLMSSHELETVVRADAPIRVVVLNDFAFGAIRERQDPPIGTELRNPDFVQFARSFGVPARVVATGRDVGPAAAWLWDQEGPCLLDVRVDRTERRTLMAGHDLGEPLDPGPVERSGPDDGHGATIGAGVGA